MSPNAATEQTVSQHYGRRDLEQAILDALVASDKDIDHLAPSDLSPVDEFHTGGREATIDFAALMDFTPAMHVLDIGCGIGGPSRYVAERFGCRVTGIDLTPEFIRTADALARRVGLSERVAYRQASALALPFDSGAFDGAYMMHVGMNIEDKQTLFAEARRVLKTGSMFAIFDVMQSGDGDLYFPVPWAATAETNFVASAAAYRRALLAAGFEISKERNRLEFARTFFREVQARTAACGGPPPLGTHILMKNDAAQKIANVMRNLDEGLIAPIEIVCRAR